MSYTIQYDTQHNRKYNTCSKKKRSYKKLLFPALMGMLFASFFIKQVRSTIVDIIFPGDSEVTFRAAENMTRDLKEGESFKSAFTDFCVEIISNA